MAFNRSNDTLALTPDEHGPEYFQPLREAATVLNPLVSTSVYTNAKTYRVPVVTGTPTAAWVPEGQDIGLTDPTVTEVSVTPPKVAALTKISRELIDDSEGAGLNLTQAGMVTDLARKVDEAFFGAPASPEAPQGLRDLANVQEVNLAGAFANADAFAEGLSLAETVGARVTSFVAHPTTVLALSTLKEATGSQRPLLTADVTVPGSRSVQGVPLLSSQYVEPGVVWALPNQAVISVIRTPAELAVSPHGSAFVSYSMLARIVQRIGFLFPHEEAIVKITENSES